MTMIKNDGNRKPKFAHQFSSAADIFALQSHEGHLYCQVYLKPSQSSRHYSCLMLQIASVDQTIRQSQTHPLKPKLDKTRLGFWKTTADGKHLATCLRAGDAEFGVKVKVDKDMVKTWTTTQGGEESRSHPSLSHELQVAPPTGVH